MPYSLQQLKEAQWYNYLQNTRSVGDTTPPPKDYPFLVKGGPLMYRERYIQYNGQNIKLPPEIFVGGKYATQDTESNDFNPNPVDKKKLIDFLGLQPPPEPYSKMLRESLDAGVDLKPLYGDRYGDAVQFQKDLGLSRNKDTGLIIPANPVGYSGGFKFDPNYGSTHYRELAEGAGKLLGLSPEQVRKDLSGFVNDTFYSGGRTKATIGFTNLGNKLLDNLLINEGLPEQGLENVRQGVLKPLYDTNDQMFSKLRQSAAIESQTSGVFKSFAQGVTEAVPGIVHAGLNAVTGGLWGLGLGVASGDMEGALKQAIINQATAGVGSAAGSAATSGLKDGIFKDALQSGISSGISSELSGGDFTQGFLTGSAGQFAGEAGQYVDETTGNRILGEGVQGGLEALGGNGDILEGVLKGAGSEALSGLPDALEGYFKGINFPDLTNFGSGFNLPDFNLPNFDLPNFNLPSFSGVEVPNFNLPDVNFPSFSGNLPQFNAPEFNTPNTQGGSDMSVLDTLFSNQELEALLNFYGSEDQIDRIRDIGQRGQTMFGDIASQVGEGAGFTPYNITSGIGTSRFDDGAGALQPDPRFAGLTDQAVNLSQGLLGAAGGSTQDQAQELYNLQQQMAQPGIDRNRLALENRLRAQGRLGQQTAAYGGSPEQLAFEKALQEQDAANRFNSIGQAEQLATSQLGRSQWLLNMAMQPDQFLLNQLRLGGNLGSAQSSANLGRNSLVSGLLSKGAMMPLQAEGVAGALEGQQLAALSNILTGQNPIGSAVNTGLGSIGDAVGSFGDSLLGGISSLFGGTQPAIGSTLDDRSATNFFNQYPDLFGLLNPGAGTGDAPMDNTSPTDFFSQYPDLAGQLNPQYDSIGSSWSGYDYNFFI